MKPRTEKVKEFRNGEVFVGVHMDKEIFTLLDAKVKELGLTKEKYIRELLLKDLGLTYVPGHYEKLD